MVGKGNQTPGPGLLAETLAAHTYTAPQTLQAGTIAFMAPECFEKEYARVSEKSDIFSLAVILWVRPHSEQLGLYVSIRPAGVAS